MARKLVNGNQRRFLNPQDVQDFPTFVKQSTPLLFSRLAQHIRSVLSTLWRTPSTLFNYPRNPSPCINLLRTAYIGLVQRFANLHHSTGLDFRIVIILCEELRGFVAPQRWNFCFCCCDSLILFYRNHHCLYWRRCQLMKQMFFAWF